MAEDKAMPQADGCGESDDSQDTLTGMDSLARANGRESRERAESQRPDSARALAERVLREFEANDQPAIPVMVRIDPSTTARTITEAIGLLFRRTGRAIPTVTYYANSLYITFK